MSLVEIEFKGRRKGIYTVDPETELKRYDRVIVRADRGEDIGTISLIGEEWQEKLLQLLEIEKNGHSNGKPSKESNGGDEKNSDDEKKEEDAESEEEVTEENIVEKHDVPDILRVASAEEVEQEKENRKEEREARKQFLQEIGDLNLEMNLVDVEYQLDRKKLTFYFTADGRVDFRELVKRLAQHFRTRIDLRQIGARDEAKRLGGIGICGRELCCATWIREFKPVTTSMLKEQGLLLNPQKNTGLCGKLRCCLRYEVDQYREVNRLFPKEGMKVKGPRGAGVVEKISMCHSSMGVKWEDGQRIGYSFDQVRNITDWDHEKRDQITLITFREDPSVIQQEKEEREGRLLTSFEYEKVLEKDDDKNKKSRPSRRRGKRRGKDQNEQRGQKSSGSKEKQTQAKSEQQAKSGQQQGSETGREDDKRSRGSKRGRRGGRGRRRGSGRSQDTKGEGSAPKQDAQSPKQQDKPKKQDRRSRRDRDKPEKKGEARKDAKKPEQNNQGGESRPKGAPVHNRGRKRKR